MAQGPLAEPGAHIPMAREVAQQCPCVAAASAAQVLLAGGSGEYCSNSMTPAGQTSFLIDVSPGADHTIQEETLAFSQDCAYPHL